MDKVTINQKRTFTVESNQVDGKEMPVDMVQISERFYHILYDHKSYSIEVVKHEAATKTFTLKINGNMYEAQVKDKFDQLLEKMGFDASAKNKVKELKAPMPGLVID